MTSSHYRGVNAVIIVFDVMDEDTFTDIINWIEEVKEKCSLLPKFSRQDDMLLKMPIFLFLEIRMILKIAPCCSQLRRKYVQKRMLSISYVIRTDQDQNLTFLIFKDISAKTGQGVEEAFRKITQQISERMNGNLGTWKKKGKQSKPSTLRKGGTLRMFFRGKDKDVVSTPPPEDLLPPKQAKKSCIIA